jgi:predicted transcriptional regulator
MILTQKIKQNPFPGTKVHFEVKYFNISKRIVLNSKLTTLLRNICTNIIEMGLIEKF